MHYVKPGTYKRKASIHIPIHQSKQNRSHIFPLHGTVKNNEGFKMITTPTEIKVNFHPEMIRAMFDCGKDRTSRFKKLGKIGDTFTLIHPDTLEQRKWQISEINKHTLGEVAIHMHKKEGFVSEEDFMKFWRKVHPERNNPRAHVYVHMLEGVKEIKKV
jgi:hypothetical protein